MSSRCGRIGRQSWFTLAVVITEVLVVCKFDWALVTAPPPRAIAVCWLLGVLLLVCYIVWQFYLKRMLLLKRLLSASSRLLDARRRSKSASATTASASAPRSARKPSAKNGRPKLDDAPRQDSNSRGPLGVFKRKLIAAAVH